LAQAEQAQVSLANPKERLNQPQTDVTTKKEYATNNLNYFTTRAKYHTKLVGYLCHSSPQKRGKKDAKKCLFSQ
jgi:hypothetical protein